MSKIRMACRLEGSRLTYFDCSIVIRLATTESSSKIQNRKIQNRETERAKRANGRRTLTESLYSNEFALYDFFV